MRTFSVVALVAAVASASPLVIRQEIVGQSGADFNMVNGPTALSNPTVNNGALKEGSIDSSTSLDGATIVNPIGNSITGINNNFDFHDNILENPNVNAAQNTEGGAVVGNNNQVFPGFGGSSHIVFRRQAPAEVSNVNAPAAINDPTVNNGALTEGSVDADLSFAGANVQNPVGNSLAQVNDNTEVSDNNFVDPNWNTISNNNGPAMAGNDNTFIPINNQGMIVNLDPGFMAGQQAQQAALISHFVHPGLF
ncbi:hypothetical protein LPJ62_001630 [Coemansia sp. RSA 2167]|nr:hypothetical protein LPJ62_001630 [Coemansia sp. RSA 2167]KAJ2132501.1 hypothetical protein GGF48_000897 [Coemansia sp. RSA 921]KAJ2133323.1 hypothetical protein GGH17_003208 [Coemansia sp. RSA 788]KAJ2158176.1 hypothetical protein GGH15_005257 [Coemansia sp. RSA 562]KAJ2184651.1 hypothetical protein EV181_004272 [Coemansia sp. RSA 532]KAJ2225439.1 hypothetical protein EV180_003407 [Coemansia sp. RSA 518]KAJ2236660.1 hypothetical protein GGH97_005536 [Coemansia sp. RSA 475]KAJ2256852.1 hy